jgi:DNA repair protein RadA/Sms
MARSSTVYRCQGCGASADRWYGRCPRCGEFSTLVEQAPPPATPGLRSTAKAATPGRPARRVSEVVTGAPVERMGTGIGEFDRVLGGGLVAGQVCLCSGPPGSGKSTLLLAVADSVARRSARPVLYVSGEESVEQIGVRAHRIGADSPHLLLADDTDLAAVIGHVQAHSPDVALVIIDSVQTVASSDVDGRAGGVTQTMEVAQVLTRVAKSSGVPMILVGQVTKDSTVAGPRALEHIVDTTLSLDGDKHTSLRLLRTVKNRFGSLEVAAFEQSETGMHEVLDPSGLFREHRDIPVPGTCVGVTVEGQRALTAEIQSLVAATNSPNPRRGVSGLDSARSAMLIAISERAAKLRLFDKDVYLATVAGMRVSDPGTDLALCLAVISATEGQPVPLDLVAIGEVALSGDVRPVPMLAERVAEAARLGFRRLLVPAGSRARLKGRSPAATVVEVSSLRDAVSAMRRAGLTSVQ